MKVRTRIAPSPTGFFHVGNLRTALYDYALAKKHGGQFILRIEDTDRERYVPEAIDFILRTFNEFGLIPDEGPEQGGAYSPYVQSERLDTYKEYAQKLIEKGKAFYCFLTPEETKELQENARASGNPFRSPFRDIDTDEAMARVTNGDPHTIRYKMVKDVDITGTCELQGEITINSNELEDWVLIKTDGFPVYNLAVVIDDHIMQITHVFRGVEFISSLPKNVLLYQDFGWEMPKFFHLPVLMDPDGGKLSKRKGAVNVGEFLEQGYLPPAILNFLMLLGWSSPKEREYGEAEQEIFSMEEFIELFDTKDLNKSNPVFNREKLLWFNQQYIMSMPLSELAGIFIGWAKSYSNDPKLIERIENDKGFEDKLELVKTRAKTLGDIPDMLRFFYIPPQSIDWDIKQLKNLDKAQIQKLLEEIKEFLESLPEDTSKWQHPVWEEGMRAIGDKLGVKHGDVFMVLRLAVVGSPYSPPLFESLQLLDKEAVKKRMDL